MTAPKENRKNNVRYWIDSKYFQWFQNLILFHNEQFLNYQHLGHWPVLESYKPWESLATEEVMDLELQKCWSSTDDYKWKPKALCMYIA